MRLVNCLSMTAMKFLFMQWMCLGESLSSFGASPTCSTDVVETEDTSILQVHVHIPQSISKPMCNPLSWALGEWPMECEMCHGKVESFTFRYCWDCVGGRANAHAREVNSSSGNKEAARQFAALEGDRNLTGGIFDCSPFSVCGEVCEAVHCWTPWTAQICAKKCFFNFGRVKAAIEDECPGAATTAAPTPSATPTPSNG